MPRGYRGIVVAAFGCLILAGASPPNKGAPTPKAEQRQAIARPALPPPAPKAYQPYPGRNADDCYEADNHDAADLCAQWRAAVAAEKAAKAAERGNWIAGGGAALSFLSILLILAALKVARQANEVAMKESGRNTRRAIASAAETARAFEVAERSADNMATTAKTLVEANAIALRQLTLEQRAWLYPRITSFQRILFNKHGIQIDFTYQVKNHGRTHANVVFQFGKLINSRYDVRGEIETIAKRMQNSEDTTLMSPDEMAAQTQFGQIQMEDILIEESDQSTYATIMIAVFYRTAVDQEMRYTVRCFEVFDTNTHGHITPLIFGSDIPAERLRHLPKRSGNIAT